MKKNKQIFLAIILSMLPQLIVAKEVQGVLAWSDVSQLGFPVNGVIDGVKVKPGMRVKKGQLLAQLEQKPFQLIVKRCQAKVDTVEPLLFDAKLELTHAEELFERTVLSEVELQRVEAKYKGLEAQKQVETMNLRMAKWRMKKSTLVAPFDAIVVENNMLGGQVVSDESSAQIMMSIVRVGAMNVNILLDDLSGVAIDHAVKIKMNGDEYKGKLSYIKINKNNNQFNVVASFNYPDNRQYWPGQSVSVIY